MRLKILSTLLFCSSVFAYGQTAFPDSVTMLFARQLEVFPQEKIYLHTDKSYYVAGEKIWFRAHLADAAMHIPEAISRYTYVELLDPLDSVLIRVKIRPENGSYHGHMAIPEDTPEGTYEMRAYTSFMQSAGEDYFCTRSIRIGHPQSRSVVTNTKFGFESDRRVSAEFHFTDTGLSAFKPETIMVRVNNGKPMSLKADEGGRAGITFSIPPDSKYRVLLLESVQDKYRYRQYISIPVPDDDLDVSFYPEGGALLTGTASRVAFKAMRSDGRAADIAGAVYDNAGNKICDFESGHLGMGSLMLLPEEGKSYHVILNAENGTKRFELPPAQGSAYALTCRLLRNRLFIAVLKPAAMISQDTLYLVAHTRGLVHFTALWEPKREFIAFHKEQFPSGVMQLLLLDKQKRPLSERLVFINNNDQAQVIFQPDKANYDERALVKNQMKITDPENNPLSGSFSVAVTDDHEVQTDTTSNILSTLLLTSDLRGKIADPAFYFRKGAKPAEALELLMLTQGWRRYHVADILSERFARPTTFLEVGPEISGTVKTLLMGKPAPDIPVTILSLKGDYFESMNTDSLGHFYFRNGELPDSTSFIVQALEGKGMKRFELIVNTDRYPARSLRPLPIENVSRKMMIQYGEKTEQKYTFEHGIRNIYLDEITVTADRKPVRKSDYYSYADNSITEDVIDRFHPSDIRMLLMQLPGVMVSGSKVSIRGQGDPLLVVDGVTMDIADLDMVNVYDVAQVDVLKNASNTAVFGSRGGNGVIVIFTKEGKIGFQPKPFHIKTILPLGYQSAAEFYAPKYDTPETPASKNPDLRTTIHWEPNVRIDSTGVATFSFYTADAETSYSVIIEGLTSNGKIIHCEGKIMRGSSLVQRHHPYSGESQNESGTPAMTHQVARRLQNALNPGIR
jgi:TonB-dependent SusC/RagA subfamily outer membrane receptor